MNELLRGYATGVIEKAKSRGDLAQLHAEILSVRSFFASNSQLSYVMSDPALGFRTRQSIGQDLLKPRIGDSSWQLILFAIRNNVATEFMSDLEWLYVKLATEAGSLGPDEVLMPTADPAVGRFLAKQRLEGYAAANYDGLDESSLINVEDELFRLARIIESCKELQSSLSDVQFPLELRESIILDLLKDRASEITTRLVSYALYATNGRNLVGLLDFLSDRASIERGARVAEVHSVTDLDDNQKQRLGQALEQVVGHHVDIRIVEDKSLLGGIMAVVGDTVIDDSIRYRLNQLRTALTSVQSNSGSNGDGDE